MVCGVSRPLEAEARGSKGEAGSSDYRRTQKYDNVVALAGRHGRLRRAAGEEKDVDQEAARGLALPWSGS
jgi:hypothetical protein